MRSSRLLTILILLQLRVRLTAEELASELGVSVRTIYRDIEQLDAAGIPVYGDRGPGGGFQLVGGYQTRLTGLAADEARALFLVGLPGPAAALGFGPAATRARRKLLASLPATLSEGAGNMMARFHLDPIEWYRAPEPVPHLAELARAVLEQRRVGLRYESWRRVRDWELEPLGLVLKAGAWYLAARGEGGDKVLVFKVSKVLDLAAREATFSRPADFDLVAFWSAEIVRFEEGLRPGKAVLRLSLTGRERLARQGSHAARAVREATLPAADGWAQLVLPIESTEDAALTVLGLGPEVEVLEPPGLRDRVRDMAAALLRIHEPAPPASLQPKPQPRASARPRLRT